MNNITTMGSALIGLGVALAICCIGWVCQPLWSARRKEAKEKRLKAAADRATVARQLNRIAEMQAEEKRKAQIAALVPELKRVAARLRIERYRLKQDQKRAQAELHRQDTYTGYQIAHRRLNVITDLLNSKSKQLMEAEERLVQAEKAERIQDAQAPSPSDAKPQGLYLYRYVGPAASSAGEIVLADGMDGAVVVHSTNTECYPVGWRYERLELSSGAWEKITGPVTIQFSPVF